MAQSSTQNFALLHFGPPFQLPDLCGNQHLRPARSRAHDVNRPLARDSVVAQTIRRGVDAIPLWLPPSGMLCNLIRERRVQIVYVPQRREFVLEPRRSFALGREREMQSRRVEHAKRDAENWFQQIQTASKDDI